MIARAFLVVGLGYGDEGKGSVVDWLARVTPGARTVVRYNGGSQAAHHVVTAAGQTHCFSQFGAGTLVPGVRSFLSRFTVVDPLALDAEARALAALGVGDAYQRLTVDPRCVLVTPFHRILNQMRETARGDGRHGSCGLGIAEARLDSERPAAAVVRVADISAEARLRDRVRLLWLTKVDQAEQLADAHPHLPALAQALEDIRRADRVPALVEAYRAFGRRGVTVADEPGLGRGGAVIFEGAQGVLLDRELGFWPHVTPSTTTLEGAHALLGEWGGAPEVARVGVLRAYATRHGAGPLVTEDADLTRARPDAHNGAHPWQGAFRLGHFDAVAARYAVAATGGVDRLVITNVDRLAGLPRVRMCTGYADESGLAGSIPGATTAAERLARTRWLTGCRPRYRDLPGWPPASGGAPWRPFVEALASAEGVGVAIDTISEGPTAADKVSLGAQKNQ